MQTLNRAAQERPTAGPEVRLKPDDSEQSWAKITGRLSFGPLVRANQKGSHLQACLPYLLTAQQILGGGPWVKELCRLLLRSFDWEEYRERG
jgi:hypothetical protein